MKTITTTRKNSLTNVLTILTLLFASFFINAQVGIGTTTPLSTFEVNGSNGQTVTVTDLSTALTLDASHSIVICDNGSTAGFVTLPTASDITGRIYTIKRDDLSTAYVTITTTSSQTIDGAKNIILKNAGESVTLVSIGTAWKTTSSNNSSRASSDNLMFPMGEISYFSFPGFPIAIPDVSDGVTNMVACNAPTSITDSGMDFVQLADGKLQYTGTATKSFHVACTISMTPTVSNDQFVFGVAKNGTVIPSSKVLQRMTTNVDAQSTALHVMVTLAKDDYLQLYVGNVTTAGGISLKSLCLFALGMGM